MTVRKRPILNFVFSQAILFAVGAVLLVAGVLTLLKQQPDWLGNGSFVLLGGCVLLVAIQRAADVFCGKTVLEQVLSLPLPGTAAFELAVPAQMNKGRVIVFFQNTTERYAGKVMLTKVPTDGGPPVSATLLRIVPRRIKIPKWSPTSDAGKVMEVWPRKTGGATLPVVLRFSFPVEAGEKLKVEFQLESNFKGTELERRFPVTGNEMLRVAVKE